MHYQEKGLKPVNQLGLDSKISRIVLALEKANEIIDRYATEKLESDKIILKLLEQINLREEIKWSFGDGKQGEDVVRIKSDLNNLSLRVNDLERAIDRPRPRGSPNLGK